MNSSLDFRWITDATHDWKMFHKLLNSPGLPPEHQDVYNVRLRAARQELKDAAADLDRQRKREIEAWAKPRGLHVNWSEWDRQ